MSVQGVEDSERCGRTPTRIMATGWEAVPGGSEPSGYAGRLLHSHFCEEHWPIMSEAAKKFDPRLGE